MKKSSHILISTIIWGPKEERKAITTILKAVAQLLFCLQPNSPSCKTLKN